MNITVFCGASIGAESIYREKAVGLAEWIVDRGHTLIYGGGKAGMMGTVADAALDLGGRVIGVIPTFLVDRELANPRVKDIKIVGDMDQRKKYMIENGDAFIAMPGGAGTLEEIAEVISWARVGQNDSPCVVYNVNGYYDPLRDMYDRMVEEGFLSREDRELTLFSDDLEEIERFILDNRPPVAAE